MEAIKIITPIRVIKFIYAVILLLVSAKSALANPNILWYQEYLLGVDKSMYHTTAYCVAITPGHFIGTVRQQLENGALTSDGIFISHFTFHQQKINSRLYRLYGTALEDLGTIDGVVWRERIHYRLSKTEPNGDTYGEWSTSRCIGRFVGYAIAPAVMPG